MGKFITIDGLDGSGKSTQYEALASHLESRGIRVRRLKFPVYNSEGSALARMYLSGALGSADETNAYAASMFFAADRYVSYVTDWKTDYLDPDTVILADRYTTANAIHQLSKLPRGEWESFVEWLYDFEFGKLSLPRPDAVVFLSVPIGITEMMTKRRESETGVRRDIHETDYDYIKRCCEAGAWAKDRLGWRGIECADGGALRPREAIASDIRRALSDILAID